MRKYVRIALITLAGLYFTFSAGCQTVLTVRPGDTTVQVDSPLDITAKIEEGSIPKNLGIKMKNKDIDQWRQPENMSRVDGEFKYTIPSVTQSFQYMIDIRAVGAGPYKVTVGGAGPEYELGRKLALDYRSGTLRDYRIVITLRQISAPKREEFLRGFAAAYAEANDTANGTKYSAILKEAVSGDHFDRAFEQGQKHVNNQVTDAQIQTLICSSVGVSGSVALGWQAGYIEGFKQETIKNMSSKGQKVEEESYYQQGQAMYDALLAAASRR